MALVVPDAAHIEVDLRRGVSAREPVSAGYPISMVVEWRTGLIDDPRLLLVECFSGCVAAVHDSHTVPAYRRG